MERRNLQYQSSNITFKVKKEPTKLTHIKRLFSVLDEKKAILNELRRTVFDIQIQG